MKEMGKKWSTLDKESKLMFMKAANEDKDRYESEMKEYNIVGGKGKSIQDFDSQRPKKCLSAYMIFVRETRPKIVKEKEAALEENESKLIYSINYTLDMNVLEIMKEVGRRWKQLTEEGKSEFENKAKEDKKRFDREMTEFNKEINKINIASSDSKKSKSRTQKSSKVKKQAKGKRGRKKNKKQSEAQKDYYYPTRPQNEEKDQEETGQPRCDYLLRRRTKNTNKMFYASGSEESEESDSDKISYNRYGVANKQRANAKTSSKRLSKTPVPNDYMNYPPQQNKEFIQQDRSEVERDKPARQNKRSKKVMNRWAMEHDYDTGYKQFDIQNKEEIPSDMNMTRNTSQKNMRTRGRRSKINNPETQNDYQYMNAAPNQQQNTQQHSGPENKITISVNMDRNRGNEENKQKRERRSK